MVGRAVFQRLDVIVDIDGNRSRDACQISADHQDHAEFSEGMRETQHYRSYHTGKG